MKLMKKVVINESIMAEPTDTYKPLPEAVQDEVEAAVEETESSMTIADIMKMFADFQEEAPISFAPIKIDGKEIAITGCKVAEGDDGVIEITFDYDMPAAEEETEAEDAEVEEIEGGEETEEAAETEEITEALDDITTDVVSKYSEAIEAAKEAGDADAAKVAVIEAIANFVDLLKSE